MLKKLRINPLILLVLISIIGFCLRIYRLSDNPPSLNWDEISHGYNAFSILKTGSDEWGVRFPIIFKAYGDYKLPAYIYLTALSELIFGQSAFAVRIVSVLAGTVTIVFTYFLTRELLGNVIKNGSSLSAVRLLSSFLVAVEPWSLFLSRPAFEANLGLSFFVLGYFLLLKSRQKFNLLPFSLVLLGLTVWTYNSYRIFVPLMLVSTLFVYRDKFIKVLRGKKFINLISAFVVLVFFVPMFVQLLTSAGSARFSKVSIIDEGAVGKIIATRESMNLNPTIERLIANKYTYATLQFTKNWISTYSPRFFIDGGDNYQFSIPKIGLLYLIDLPFLLLGVLFILKNYKKTRLIILWIFFAPIAGSLTREAPHVLRNITILPIPMVLSSLGVVKTVEFLAKYTEGKTTFSNIIFNRRNALYFVYIMLLSVFTGNYLANYFGQYRNNYSWSWQYGYKEAAGFVRENYGSYDKIIFTKKYGEPHEFLLFYLDWDPSRFIADRNLVRYNQSGWYWVDSFDKFVFVNEWDIPIEEWQAFITEKGALTDCTDKKCLLFSDGDSVPKTWSKLEEIKFLDGKVAFDIYEN